jgi:F-type H+-transporting ATPase subunit gamma
MANLKDIRRRIKSVKNTQKITQAMRMVAAAKVKRAEAASKLASRYTVALSSQLELLLQGLGQQGPLEEASPWLQSAGLQYPKRLALVVITSDRGLCGGYNTNVLRQAQQQLEAYQSKGVAVRLVLIGNKAVQYLSKRFPKVGVLYKSAFSALQGPEPNAVSAREALLATLIQAYDSHQVEAVELLSTRFKSLIQLNVKRQGWLPLAPDSLAAFVQAGLAAPQAKAAQATEAPNTTTMTSELVVEPSMASVLPSLMHSVLKQQLLQVLLEAQAAELAARMTAMAAATDNAKGMIQRLTLEYNKARQAAITQEIMEIIGGAEALA